MEVAVGETQDAAFGLTFDRRLKSKITSDGGLLACRELDDVLGLSKVAGEVLTDTRTGANGRHTLQGQFRQSVFGRLAGYEDLNDADRLADDPAMRWVVGGRAVTQKAASTSQMGRFETEVMSDIPPHRTACMDTVDPEPAQVRQCRQVLGLIHGYVIRLPANAVLQRRIAHLLTRPVGRPPHEVIPTRVKADSFRGLQTGASQIPWRRTGGSPCGQGLHFVRTMTRPSFGPSRKRRGMRVKVGGCWRWPRSMMAAPGPGQRGLAALACRPFGTGLCGSTRAVLTA